MRWTSVVLLGAVAAAPPAAYADTAEALARCAAIAGPGERLACYDALAGRTEPTPSQPVVAAAPDPRSDPKNFGLNPALQLQQPVDVPQSVTARVTRLADDGRGQMLVGLDNGQTWLTDEVDPRLGLGDKVTIKRAALGSFLLTTPTKRSYRARRTQ